MAILFCHLFFCIKKSELVAFFFGGYFPTAPLFIVIIILLCSSLKYEPAILCHEAKYSTMLLHYADHAFGPIPMTLLPCHRKALMEYRL